MITGSIVALVTPMLADGSLDWPTFGRLIDHHISARTDALVIAGTTGESATLTTPEHCEVIAFAVEQSGGRIPIIAGTGSNATHEAIELTVQAAQAGADASLSVVPYYNRPTQEGLYRHFSVLAEAVNIPTILYNVPGRTACDLDNETVVRLSAVDSIVGIKDATGDVERGAALIESLPDGFAVYSGDDFTALDLMRHGAQGNISVTANVVPALMAELCRLALAGDYEGALAIDARLQPLHAAMFLEPNPIPVKWALAHLGHIAHGLRLPMTDLSDEYTPAVAAALEPFCA